MARVKTKETNPCHLKGIYGKRDPGRYYTRGNKCLTIACCECAAPFLSVGAAHEERITYAMIRSSDGEVRVKPLTSKISGQNLLIVVPCRKMFSDETSRGTVSHLADWSDKNSATSTGFFPPIGTPEETLYTPLTDYTLTPSNEFTGCISVENYLLKTGRVLHAPKWPLGANKDSLLWIDEMELSDAAENNLQSPDDIRFDFDLLNEEDARSDDPMKTKLDSLKESPGWNKFYKSLTNPQKEAMNSLYTETGEEITKVSAAKRLGISIDSFKERLQGIRKKGERFLGKVLFKKSNKKKLDLSSDLLFDGFHRKSSAKIKYPAYRIQADGTRELIIDRPARSEPSRPLVFCGKF